MGRYDVLAVRGAVVRIAQAVGVPTAEAETLADALVDADVRGLSTHGVSRLATYVRRIQLGLVDPKAPLRVEREAGSVLVVDARNGLGQVQASKVLQLLVAHARRNGVAAATIRNSNHFGTLSYYCNKAAAEDMILLATTNAEPAMSPEGGCQPYFGTNPLAASFPTGKGYPVEVDLATSVVARGAIIAAERRGERIPADWAFDVEGNPTTDAAQALLGTVRTMAGHKGYALAFMVEAFAGVLTGAAVASHVGSMYKNLDRPQNVGHFFCLLDIRAFIEPDEFRRRIDSMIGEIKESRRRPGIDEVIIPGEQTARLARENRMYGIPLGEETVSEIKQVCAQLNVPFGLEAR